MQITDDVLKPTIDIFCETIALELSQFRKFIPKSPKTATNSALTGGFVEELVKEFIRKWIGHRRYLTGTLFSGSFSGYPPKQIDGIVYDPTAGPLILNKGDFAIIHPAFCSQVIEVKTSCSNFPDFRKRLSDISRTYMGHRTAAHVMGIIISDSDPKQKTEIVGTNGFIQSLYDFTTVGHCPVCILFKEVDGDYEPYEPAIRAMISNIYDKQYKLERYF